MQFLHKSAIALLLMLFCELSRNTACSQPCSDFQNRKTHYRFRLLKAGLHVDTARVRTTGVYMSEGIGHDCRYSFTRFFENGKVFMSGAYQRLPTPDEMNDLRYGRYGYYRVDSDVLTIESYWQNGRWGSRGYTRNYYRIGDTAISMFAIKYRGIGGKPIMTAGPGLNRIYYLATLKPAIPFW